MSSECPL
jgi:hypothetical protein